MSRRPPRRGGGGRTVALLLTALTAVTALVTLAGCSTSSAGGAGTNFVAGDGAITLVPLAKREAPVQLRGTTLEGAPLDVAAWRGKVVVLNVWGSWCPPCRKEAPELQAASEQLKAQGVRFVGLDTSDPDVAQALAFQKTFGVTYPSLTDPSGQLLLALRGAVAANAVPTTLVLDAQGRIAARISSATTKATLVDVVQDVASGKAAA